MRGENFPKIVFGTRYGHYEFIVLSFGLKTKPTAFNDLINRVFQDYFDSFVIVFIDDILIYSMNEDKHESHLRLALKVLKEH